MDVPSAAAEDEEHTQQQQPLWDSSQGHGPRLSVLTGPTPRRSAGAQRDARPLHSACGRAHPKPGLTSRQGGPPHSTWRRGTFCISVPSLKIAVFWWACLQALPTLPLAPVAFLVKAHLSARYAVFCYACAAKTAMSALARRSRLASCSSRRACVQVAASSKPAQSMPGLAARLGSAAAATALAVTMALSTPVQPALANSPLVDR